MAIFFRPSDFRRLSQGPPGCTPKGHFEGKIYMKFIPKKDRDAFMIHPKLGIIPKAGLPEFLSKYTKNAFQFKFKSLKWKFQWYTKIWIILWIIYYSSSNFRKFYIIFYTIWTCQHLSICNCMLWMSVEHKSKPM